MELGIAQNEVVGFVQKVCPYQTLGWNTIILSLAGFLNSVSKERRARRDETKLIINDIWRLAKGAGDDEFNAMNNSLDFATVTDLAGIQDSKVGLPTARVLHVAGRIIDCIHHTKRLMRVKRKQEKHNTPLQHHRLERSYPWLTQILDPTVMRTVDEWWNWIGECSNLLQDRKTLDDQFQLGTRYYLLWRALDLSNEVQDEIAHDFAAYNAHLVMREGRPFLQRILTALQERFPNLQKLSIEEIQSTAKQALESASPEKDKEVK